MNYHKNTEKTGVTVGIVLAAIGFAMMILPYPAGMDMMSGGYALGFVGLFLVVCGGVTSVVYWMRVRAETAILADQDVLARWQYAPAEWRRYVEQEYATERSEKAALFWLTTLIIILVGAGFVIFGGEAGLAVGGILAAVDLILAGVAILAPWLIYRRSLRHPGEVLIAPQGVYLGGGWHIWNQLGAHLEKVTLTGQPPRWLEFEYSYPSRTGRQVETVRVPVPANHEDEARHVLAYFN